MYRIAILSPIPVSSSGHGLETLDLWARDLRKQADVSTVTLVCPLVPPINGNTAPIDERITVIPFADNIDPRRIVEATDVVQLPANDGWRQSASARRFLKIGSTAGKIVIVGVSSNRAKAQWLNSHGLSTFKAAIKYADIRFTQSWLASRADGVSVVGTDVAGLLQPFNRNIHINTASWIESSDIVEGRTQSSGPLRVCMASRMERMKGMHIGIDAVSTLPKNAITLTIIGNGPESPNLHSQIERVGLSNVTRFLAPVTYPYPFLQHLDEADVVLLTNLSDEQPRLIFDALARGTIPVCPNATAYRQFGLANSLFYRRGDPRDLSRVVERLLSRTVRQRLHSSLSEIAKMFTLESMHQRRAAWISALLAQRQ